MAIQKLVIVSALICSALVLIVNSPLNSFAIIMTPSTPEMVVKNDDFSTNRIINHNQKTIDLLANKSKVNFPADLVNQHVNIIDSNKQQQTQLPEAKAFARVKRKSTVFSNVYEGGGSFVSSNKDVVGNERVARRLATRKENDSRPDITEATNDKTLSATVTYDDDKPVMNHNPQSEETGQEMRSKSKDLVEDSSTIASASSSSIKQPRAPISFDNHKLDDQLNDGDDSSGRDGSSSVASIPRQSQLNDNEDNESTNTGQDESSEQNLPNIRANIANNIRQSSEPKLPDTSEYYSTAKQLIDKSTTHSPIMAHNPATGAKLFELNLNEKQTIPYFESVKSKKQRDIESLKRMQINLKNIQRDYSRQQQQIRENQRIHRYQEKSRPNQDSSSKPVVLNQGHGNEYQTSGELQSPSLSINQFLSNDLQTTHPQVTFPTTATAVPLPTQPILTNLVPQLPQAQIVQVPSDYYKRLDLLSQRQQVPQRRYNNAAISPIFTLPHSRVPSGTQPIMAYLIPTSAGDILVPQQNFNQNHQSQIHSQQPTKSVSTFLRNLPLMSPASLFSLNNRQSLDPVANYDDQRQLAKALAVAGNRKLFKNSSHQAPYSLAAASSPSSQTMAEPIWSDSSVNNEADDFQPAPQTIQITAVPNGLGLQNTVLNGGGLNNFGLNNLAGWNNLAGPWNGRQVLLVNKQQPAEWRQWVIPLAVLLALPLLLGGLFVPVTLKSVMFLIQILQMLGLLLPPGQLANQMAGQLAAHVSQGR